MDQYERELKEKGVTVYRTETGDTLASVAKKLGVSKIALQRANPSLPGTGPLPAGKALLVFGANIGEQGDELALSVTEPDGRKQYVQTVTKSVPETKPAQQEIKQAQPQSEAADQPTIRVPNAVVTQEQLAALARAEIDPDFAQKELAQRRNYDRALEDVRNCAAAAEG